MIIINVFLFFFASRERQTELARPIRQTAIEAMDIGLGGGNSSISFSGQRACHAMTYATEQRWKECNLAESTWIINVWKNKQSRQRSGEIVWSRHINQTCPSGMIVGLQCTVRIKRQEEQTRPGETGPWMGNYGQTRWASMYGVRTRWPAGFT